MSPAPFLRSLAWGATVAVAALTLSPQGAHSATPRVHAIVGARIVTAPGQSIERGTIVIRDGVITAVGSGVAVPPDARVWDADSLTVYAGLIDAFVQTPESTPARATAGGRRPSTTAAPESRIPSA